MAEKSDEILFETKDMSNPVYARYYETYKAMYPEDFLDNFLEDFLDNFLGNFLEVLVFHW